MKTELLRADHPVALQHAVDVLSNGGLVVFPTDTVYGLATLPHDREFVDRIYSVKGRNNTYTHAIAVLLGEIQELRKATPSPSSIVLRLAKQFWPGPLTLVVPRHPKLPENLSPEPTIGVRIPDHPVALALLRMIGPLAVTTASLFGEEITQTAQEALSQLNGRVHLILDGGRTFQGIPSTVVDCTTDKPLILRHGPITVKQLEEALA